MGIFEKLGFGEKPEEKVKKQEEEEKKKKEQEEYDKNVAKGLGGFRDIDKARIANYERIEKEKNKREGREEK